MHEEYTPGSSCPSKDAHAEPGLSAVEASAAVAPDGPTVINTPEGIRMYHLLQLKYCMKIQMRTGLVHSQGSVFNHVKKTYGLRGNHAKVYAAFCKMHNLEEE